MTDLLASVGLPTEDLASVALSGFEVAYDSDVSTIGVAGLECVGENVLLRSVAVAPSWRGRSLGRRLVERREQAAGALGVRRLYLLTTSAAPFFLRIGYVVVPRSEVPELLAAHPQFRSLCPATAQCLRKSLSE